KVAKGAPCLIVERRAWGGDTPVTQVRMTYPGEAHELAARFTPEWSRAADRGERAAWRGADSRPSNAWRLTEARPRDRRCATVGAVLAKCGQRRRRWRARRRPPAR